MIVKMSEVEYNELKDKYIYSISKNGLISTRAIDKKSYLFRTTTDSAFKKYLKVTDATEEFLRLVIQEARGKILTFIEDADTKDEIIEVKDADIPPQPVTPQVLANEIKEIQEDFKIHFKEYELVFEWDDYNGFKEYRINPDNYFK